MIFPLPPNEGTLLLASAEFWVKFKFKGDCYEKRLESLLKSWTEAVRSSGVPSEWTYRNYVAKR